MELAPKPNIFAKKINLTCNMALKPVQGHSDSQKIKRLTIKTAGEALVLIKEIEPSDASQNKEPVAGTSNDGCCNQK